MNEEDFFKSIDVRLSNIGCDETWRRKIANQEIWFSPISRNDQSSIDETLNKGDLGIQYLNEAKKHNLSFAIVGIGDIDLRKVEDFYIVDPREKIKIKVSKEKYLYYKIGGWGTQFVDDVFKVFADLMESHEKSNLKNVNFENSKDPMEELAEIESRAAELRNQLNLPPLVVKDKEAEIKAVEEAVESQEPNFNPFKKVEEPQPEPVAIVSQPFVNMDGVEIDSSLNKNMSIPISSDAKQRVEKRAAEYAQMEGVELPDKTPIPVANPNILDAKIEHKVVDPPVIDRRPSTQSRNPRFSPTR